MLGHQSRISDDDVAEIVEEMESDGVWVHPAYARAQGIDSAAEERLEALVAQTDFVDLRVVLVDIDFRDDRFQGNFASLSAWLHDDLGGDAVYVGVGSHTSQQIALEGLGDHPDDLFYAARLAVREHPDDVVAQTELAVELLDQADPYALWQEIPADERYSTPSADASGDGGVPWAGIGVAVFLVLALVLAAAGWFWRRRRTQRPARQARFTLPTAVLRTVRAAEDRQLRQRAETEVLALGEALARDEHGSTHDALEAWRSALDHYDAARAILAGAGSPADVVGALVLVRRGEEARAYADGDVRGPWRPSTGCYFNPLHGEAAERVRWRTGDSAATAEVPACGDCVRAVREDQEPDDVLDFVSGDGTVHYFRLDLGAWSETGYGTVTPDLLGELRRARSGRRVRARRSKRHAVRPK